MEKNLAIYNEMRAAAERIFSEGIQAPAGVYTLAELAKVGSLSASTSPPLPSSYYSALSIRHYIIAPLYKSRNK